ncbi:BSD domain [Sesbania bispinosa]|nr:BSD domain [Sesbania bispinosa]
MRTAPNRKTHHWLTIPRRPPPAWNFGGLMKTLSVKSESIIEIYRRDLQEFGTGLKKEMEVRAIQGDPSTYTQVPEDLDRYNKWKSEFSLEGKSEEMEGFLRENDAMESVYKRVVPNTVDRETFWYRYYYKVHNLKRAEDVRARLVRRMSREEEELSWDVEEDEEYVSVENKGREEGVVGTKGLNVEEVHDESKVEKRDNLLQSKELGIGNGNQPVEESKVEKNSEVVREMGDGRKEIMGKVDNTGNCKDDSVAGSDKKVIMERNLAGSEPPQSLPTQHSEHEEELEWDEIEDLSSLDEKKVTRSGSPNKVDLRKRLSAAEEEEDLTWDIEDDDEPSKA